MFRRIALLLLLILGACAAPAASPTGTPAPTPLSLPTFPAVGPTILPSDISTPAAVLAANQPPTVPAPLPTTAPAVTPAAVGFDFALRPQYSQQLNLVSEKTVYSIQWTLNADLSELQGTQRIIMSNRTGQPLNEIYLRLFANYPNSDGSIQLQNIRVDGASLKTVLEQQNTALKIILPRPLAPTRRTTISFDYTVQIPADNKIRYADFTRTDWIATLPTVYPLIPAYDDKGWHTELPPPYGDLVYAESSIYDVTITVPSAYKVIASGQLVQQTTNGAQSTWHFIGAPMRDFDANITNTLASTSAQVDDVTINSWYLPAHADAGKHALNWTVDAFKVYEKRFGPYPFKKLDLVETPTTAGGIEYPGVITVASNLYTDPAQINYFEFATVHETAHQWWYSTVGNDQVNHPWQDESLTQYTSLIYFQDHYGSAIAQNIMDNYFTKQYQVAKDKYGDRPAGLPVSSYDEDAYGAFIYAKGPLFFQAVRDQIGDAAFFQALQTYYQQFKFRIAQPQDLINAFQQASGQNLTPLEQKWIGG